MSLTATSKVTALALCCGALSGCATGEGNQQLLGAGLGTALGCGIGYAIGGDKGCAVGGALGAAARLGSSGTVPGDAGTLSGSRPGGLRRVGTRYR